MYCFIGLNSGQWEWEVIYYVAFIVLTLLIAVLTALAVFIATKTYLFQTREYSELLCKCVERQLMNGESSLCLEIYNYGTAVAHNVKVQIKILPLALYLS